MLAINEDIIKIIKPETTKSLSGKLSVFMKLNIYLKSFLLI
tara:strand:+ start:408 stop:530 length:123 start_codon:yes stop_codon:yes gene_type:complete